MHRWSWWARTIPTLAVATIALALSARHPSAARQESGLQFSAERLEEIEEFVEASERGLNYLPGEVIVKFKPGVSPAGEQRALMALRSRPDAGDLQWNGDF